MSAQLVPIHSTRLPAVPLTRPVILIGRHPECDVRLDSPQVSRRHCCVAIAYDRLLIRDLGSRNGVRVNGRVVDEYQLRHGDEVAIAQFLYRLEASDPSPAPKPLRSASRPSPAPPVIDLDDDFIPLDD